MLRQAASGKLHSKGLQEELCDNKLQRFPHGACKERSIVTPSQILFAEMSIFRVL